MIVILAGHGKIGTAMLESTQMVIGECSNFVVVKQNGNTMIQRN